MPQTLAERIDERTKREYDEYVAKLQQESPVETEFKLGQRVVFVNDYGVIFPDREIIGFAADDSFYGRFIHINTDCYWFAVKPESLRTYNEDETFEVKEGEVVYEKPDWI